MGCSTSKIENEEVVSRCNTRKKNVREAVGARHNFAAAFSSYVIALRTVGSAFSQYGEAESRELPPGGGGGGGDSTPAAPIGPPAATATPPFNAKPPPLPTFFTPPAPAPPAPSPGDGSGAATMPPVLDPLKRSVSMPPIPMGEKKKAPPKVRKKQKPASPPASTVAEPPPSASPPAAPPEAPPPPSPPAAAASPAAPPDEKNKSASLAQPPPPPVPSGQAPPPPPPPPSSFFADLFTDLPAQQRAMSMEEEDAEEAERRRKKKQEEEMAARRREELAAAAEQRRQQQIIKEEEERRARELLAREQQRKQQEQMMKSVEEGNEQDEEDAEAETEDYDENDDGETEDEEQEEEDVTIEDVEEDVKKNDGPSTNASSSGSSIPPPSSTSVNLDLPKTDLAIVTTRSAAGLNLLNLMKKIDELFYEAYESGRDVANRLEAQRVSFHPNFIDSKSSDSNNHTNKVLRAISWSQTTVPETKNSETVEEVEAGTHASTLDRLLAWEKKLLEEIKRAEAIRIDHERKNMSLQREEAKAGAGSPARLEKSKFDLQSLQTRFVVALQGVDTARSMVLRLRDKQLYPQLLELLDGLKKMWEKIHECHSEQQNLVNNMKVDLSDLVEFTNDFQKVATEQLKTALDKWYQHFGSVVSTEREYMRQLNAYVRVSIVPLENYGDKSSTGLSDPPPPIANLCSKWQQAMDRLPDKMVLEPIHSFVRAVHQIVEMQNEETKLKKRVDHYTKELEKKEKYVADYEKKHLSSFTGSNTSSMPPGTPSTPSDLDDKNEMLEMARHPLTEKRAQLEVLRRRTHDEKEKAEMLTRDMRTKKIVTLETNLPSVFRSATHYSKLCSEAHKGLYEIAKESMLGNSPSSA